MQQGFLEKRTRPPTIAMTMPSVASIADDHDKVDLISPGAKEMTWTHRIRSVFLRAFSCLMFIEMKKEKKKAAEDKKPAADKTPAEDEAPNEHQVPSCDWCTEYTYVIPCQGCGVRVCDNCRASGWMYGVNCACVSGNIIPGPRRR